MTISTGWPISSPRPQPNVFSMHTLAGNDAVAVHHHDAVQDGVEQHLEFPRVVCDRCRALRRLDTGGRPIVGQREYDGDRLPPVAKPRARASLAP